MVSIKTGLTLAALLVGVVVFFGAGGFKGVGQKIGGFVGGGLSDFSSSLTSSLTGGLFGGSTNQNTGGVNDVTNVDTSTGVIGPAPRTGTEEFDPFGNLLGNFKGLQNILDTLNNTVRDIFSGGAAPVLSPISQRTLDFAVSQLRTGQTIADITIKGTQGTAVTDDTRGLFVSNLGGRERLFGSQESLNSFVERFNR